MKQILLAVALTLFLHAPLRAQEEDASRPLLEVTAAGAPATLADMARRLRALELRLALRLRFQENRAIDVRAIVAQQAEAPGVFARVWLDLTDPERAVLFIANAGHDRLLVRVVPARGGYGELTQESLATIVESAVDALLAGGQIGVDRDAALHEIEAQTGTRVLVAPAPSAPALVPKVVPEQAALTPIAVPRAEAKPAPAAGSLAPTLSLAYRGDVIGAGSALRHGLALALVVTGLFEPRFDLLIGVSGQYFLPFSLGNGERHVREQGGGGRLLLGATGQVNRLFAWQVAFSAGVDVARIAPRIAIESQLRAAAPFVVVAPLLGAWLGAVLRPAPWVLLLLGAGLDVDVSGQHFDVQGTDRRTRAVSPWRAHPFWFVGVGVPLSRTKRGRG